MSTKSYRIERERVWKTHRRREEWNECPMCGIRIRWLYTDGNWIPCNHEPVMFILHPDGKEKVIYNRKFYENSLIYKKRDERFNEMRVLQGYIQHFYTCSILKQERREWAKRKYGN